MLNIIRARTIEVEGPRNFLRGEYAVNVGNSAWPIEWKPAWVQMLHVWPASPSDAMPPMKAYVHPIDKNGDWSGLCEILPADQVRY